MHFNGSKNGSANMRGHEGGTKRVRDAAKKVWGHD
jgi:hypothetical protein